MRIQIFKNNKGLIHGSDPKRIGCDKGGILRIGTSEISISSENESILPVLFNGSTGEYKATFTSEYGNVYDLGKVIVRGGRVVSPSEVDVELMELRCYVEALEEKCETLTEQINILSHIFDTNSLNFLI
jgi:hypothetical protein